MSPGRGRLNRIENNVEEHLRHLFGIGRERRKHGLTFEYERYCPFLRL